MLSEGGKLMRYGFLLLGFLLFLVWIGAFVAFHVAGFLIHLLLIAALFFIVLHLFSTKRTA